LCAGFVAYGVVECDGAVLQVFNDPPTPVGNIAATIQAPNLSISSGGQIQNVGNVLGTSVSLTGQKLINGITTANTYTPTVNAPSQVISLSPQTMPGLNLSTPRSVGTTLPTAVAGTASYVDQSVASQTGLLGPQQLLEALPSNLQPSTTLFYYNPQEEDLMLQQAALQQTGEASFISGLSDSSTNGTVTNQEKQDLYGNAVAYAKQNNVQLGTALTQTQINALTQPMLWYVQQTVPDPDCTATGTDTCPTITALMPQVYLPANYSALSAGGNIEASNSLTLNFGSAATGGSITNTGSITSGGTLTVNTGTLTNEANQVNVGQIWNSVKGGYTDTTGTEVQAGGFMSAADMQLNVQTLQQIGGALQQLNTDGTVDQAGTQQLIAQLQRQLGGSFTQQTLSNNLNTSFVAEGGLGLGAFGEVLEMAAAVALSYVMGPLAGAMLSAALDEVVNTGSLDPMDILKAGLVAELTSDFQIGLGEGDDGGIGSNLISADPVQTLENIGQAAVTVGVQSAADAGISTAIEGGSFLSAFENDALQGVAAVGAGAIGAKAPAGSVENIALESALGCGISAAEGTGCASGAIGGAASAAFSPDLIKAMDPSAAPLTTGQQAALAGFATLLGGGLAGLAGQNVTGGATAAQNEALNNAGNNNDVATSAQNGGVVTQVENGFETAANYLSNTWIGQAGSSAVSSIWNTAQQESLLLYDNMFYTGLPGTPGPQSQLYQSVVQNGLTGTALTIGSNFVSTIQGALQGNPTAIGGLAGNLALGAALGGLAGAINASTDVAAADAIAGATNNTGLGSAINGIYSSTSPMSEVFPELNGVNPFYVENAGPGVNTNCVSCTNAVQARLTGQDANAVASPSNGYANLNGLLPSAPFGFGAPTTPASVVTEMLQAGDGAVRPLVISQPGGVSHVINAINSGGQVYFVDSQIGKIVTLQPNLSVRLGNAP
jgi:filamentous hemagglutinin